MLTKQQLLIPRVLCIGTKEGEPNDTSGEFITGDILTLTVKSIHRWKSIKLNQNVYLDPDCIEKFPHLFKPLPWWYGRKPEEMPLYVNTNCVYGVLKVQKWVLIEEKIELSWRMECEKGGLFNISHFLELIPATLEDYQEYQMNQAIKKNNGEKGEYQKQIQSDLRVCPDCASTWKGNERCPECFPI